MSNLADGVALMEWDWCYTARATRLHHASLTAEQYEIWGGDAQLEETPVVVTCGRVLSWPQVPGVFSRLSMHRCVICCRRLRYPQGVGSPKNDSAVRPLVVARIAQLHTMLEGIAP